ncbi:type II secretion system F family protein [Candidatus Uhrbacteria bacterium]|nr:type II secretion system F family protein [Candidatus Uhrbacteria bacterium]
MSYGYVASTGEGKLVRGVSELSSRNSVIRDLESRGLVVVSVDPVRRSRSLVRFSLRSLGLVSHLDKMIFIKHLTVMVKAGLSLLESLRILREQAASFRFRMILGEVVSSVEKGGSLSDSLARFPKVFSAFFVNVVRSGETAGTLEGNLEHLSEQFSRDHELRGRVRSAMMYPVFVILAALAIGFYFALYIIPQVAGLFGGLGGIEMPLATRVMMGIAGFVRNHGPALAIGTVAGLAFLVWLLRRRFIRPLTHGIILKVPIFGKLVRNINSALFCLVFGTQMRSGIPILQALEVTASVLGNWHFQQAILATAESVRRGQSLSESLAEHPRVFSRLTVRMVEVGERSGRLDEILGFLADFYGLEVETTTKNLTTILEPVMLVTIGLLALGLAYAIIIPIYNFVGSIGNMGR